MVLINSEKRYALRITIDILILVLVAIPTASFYVVPYVPFRRGYFCDDDTIRYPFHDSTVSDLMLYIYGTGIPLAIIFFTELIQCPTSKETSEDANMYGWYVPSKIQILYAYIVPFLFGSMLTDMSSNFIKFYVGRLRPNFLDACKSDFNCLTVEDPHMYVVDYTCTNLDLDQNSSDIRLSFPSGHASFSTFVMFYAVVFLQKRLIIPFTDLLKQLLQLILILLATYTAITRIQDNKHHWSDVMVGLFHGVTFCAALIYCFPIHQRKSTRSEETDITDIESNSVKDIEGLKL